MQSLFAATLD